MCSVNQKALVFFGKVFLFYFQIKGSMEDALPEHEFAYLDACFPCGKLASHTLRESTSLVASTRAFLLHIATFEVLVLLVLSLSSTLFFSFYLYDPAIDYRLAARLRFNVLVSALLLPATILAYETSRRREDVLRRLSAIRGGLAQILQAYLTWRAPSNFEMSDEWEEGCVVLVEKYTDVLEELFSLPTIRTRHSYSTRGLEFATRVKKRMFDLNNNLVCLDFEMHKRLEQLKSAGLKPMESQRLAMFIANTARDVETLGGLKVYRTPGSMRDFVRVFILVVVFFYGYVCHLG